MNRLTPELEATIRSQVRLPDGYYATLLAEIDALRGYLKEARGWLTGEYGSIGSDPLSALEAIDAGINGHSTQAASECEHESVIPATGPAYCTKCGKET